MRTASPVFANIAFLRIARFNERPVVEQATLKERLEARVRAAIAGMPVAERIVLDAADGIALVLFGEPVRALDIAQSLRAAPGEEPLKVGVNHGPIAVTARDPGAMVFGDGLTAAATAARFAPVERILLTAPFAKMLEATRPDRAAELAPAGEFTDARVRLHSFYTPEPQRLVERKNRLTAYALAGVLGILLFGVAGREVNRRYFPPRPAMVEFDVKPRGEILIDGMHYGLAPPIREVELEPGVRMPVNHTFVGARPATKPGSFWRDLRRSLGF